MKWLKTTVYNNLSRNFAENPSLTSIKHENLSARGHQWPFYHFKLHKISFLMVSESALGYLIPILLILYNLPAILRRYKILHYERESVALVKTNKML